MLVRASSLRADVVSLVIAGLLVGLSGSFARADLIGYWGFNDGSGNIASDTSGNGLHGQLLSNATLPTWVPGRSGEPGDFALQFHGGTANSGSRVDIGNPTAVQTVGSQTVSMWLNAATLPVGSARVSPLGKSYSGEGTLNIHGNGQLQFYLGNNLTTAPNSGSFVNFNTATDLIVPGTWMHITVTRDSAQNTFEYYINGELNASFNWTSHNPNSVSSGSLFIGTGYTGTFDGVIDEVTLYDEPLAPGEIASLYKLQLDPERTLYNAGIEVPELYQLWQAHRAGPGSRANIGEDRWHYADLVDTDMLPGDVWIDGPFTYVMLGTNSGMVFDSRVIPEPSTYVLLSVGLIGLFVARRFKRRFGRQA